MFLKKSAEKYVKLARKQIKPEAVLNLRMKLWKKSAVKAMILIWKWYTKDH